MSFPTREYYLILSVDAEFTQPPMKVKQDDSYSNIFNITLLSNFVAIDLTNYTTKFTARKPDGTVVFQTPTVVDAVAGKIAVVLSTQTLAVAGLAEAEISIYGTDGERITLFEFTFDVDPNIDPTNAIESSNDLPAFTELLNDSHTHVNKVDLDKIPATTGVVAGKVLKTGATGELVWGDDLTTVGEGGEGFAPLVHTHVITDTTGLQTALDGKASSTHNHDLIYADKTNTENHIVNTSNPHSVTKSQVGLGNVDNTSDLNKPISTATQTALDGKASSGHTHTGVYEPVISKNTGFNLNLGTIAGTVSEGNHTHSGYAVTSHTHAIADVTNLQTTLDGKASTTHNHAIADTTGLQTALDGKASTGHSHTGVYEPAFTKNTGFNKNFGTVGGTVAEGNHTHADLHTHTNKTLLDTVTNAGDGTQFLANDGTYKTVVSGSDLAIQDDGVAKGTATTVNFADNLTATVVGGVATITAVAGEGGGGDMYKSTYDTDNDGIVDKAENVDDGAGNSSTASQVKTAVTNSHTHSNKSTLDKITYTGVGSTVDLKGIEDNTTAIAGKANTVHAHAIVDTTGLQTALDGKSDTSHNHTGVYEPVITKNTGFNLALGTTAGTVSEGNHTHTGTYAPVSHTHAIANVTDLQTTLDGKASSTHNHDSAYAGKTATEDHIASTSNPHSVTKSQLGLGNVDNTSDLNKPISTATQTALDGKASTGHNHTGVYEPVITKNTGFNLALGTTAGTVSEGNHTHSSYSLTSHTHEIANVTGLQTALDGKASSDHNHTGVYEPSFTKNTGFNKNFGTTAGTVSEGNHTHTDLHSHANKTLLDSVTNSGDGTQFLANDGTYKTIVSGSGVAIQEDGVGEGSATTINFGDNLDVSVAGGVATVTATGGSEFDPSTDLLLKQEKNKSWKIGRKSADTSYDGTLNYPGLKDDPTTESWTGTFLKDSGVTITPTYITIHDTANFDSTANAKAHAQLIKDGTLTSYSHFYCDNVDMYQICGETKQASHTGSGGGVAGGNNSNSIGIEICIHNFDIATKGNPMSNTNYVTTVNNVVALVCYLMKKYNIPLENVVRHQDNDLEAKVCPSTFRYNREQMWNYFRDKIRENMEASNLTFARSTEYQITELSRTAETMDYTKVVEYTFDGRGYVDGKRIATEDAVLDGGLTLKGGLHKYSEMIADNIAGAVDKWVKVARIRLAENYSRSHFRMTFYHTGLYGRMGTLTGFFYKKTTNTLEPSCYLNFMNDVGTGSAYELREGYVKYQVSTNAGIQDDNLRQYIDPHMYVDVYFFVGMGARLYYNLDFVGCENGGTFMLDPNNGAMIETIPANASTYWMDDLTTTYQTAIDAVMYTTTPKDITGYTTVSAVANSYDFDLLNKPSLNFKITSADANAKSFTLANVPTVCEIFIEFTYTTACSITWFSGITWLGGSAPTLEAGKTYRMGFWTSNGGTAWHGVSQGGW